MPTSRSKEDVVQEFRVQSLQEAAMRVIARKGMAGATVQDIADEAGVAKGTIYLYFKDRDELVEKTFENAITQLRKLVDEALLADVPLETKLRESIRRTLEFFQKNGEFFRLYISHRLPEGNPQQQRRQRRHCENYRQRITSLGELLAAAMDHGEIRRTDPARLALFITEGINAIVIERTTEEPPPSIDADVELIVDMILHGIRPQGVDGVRS
jgi:AcrR family transcriptional regulator